VLDSLHARAHPTVIPSERGGRVVIPSERSESRDLHPLAPRARTTE
jgi:hypothetical protein